MLSALSQDPEDCIVTVELGKLLNVPLGRVCIKCVINGTIATDAIFQFDNSPIPSDKGEVIDGILVVFDTGALFHPSIALTVRCLSGMQQNQSSVFLEGGLFVVCQL